MLDNVKGQGCVKSYSLPKIEIKTEKPPHKAKGHKKFKLIECIGNARFNGFRADLFQNHDSSVSIRFEYFCSSLPKGTNMPFANLVDAKNFIEKNRGETDLDTLVNILKVSRAVEHRNWWTIIMLVQLKDE